MVHEEAWPVCRCGLPHSVGDTMNKYLAGFTAVALVMVALDMLWLGVIAKSIYQEAIGHLMADKPGVAAASAFYAIYAMGLVVFVLVPHVDETLWGHTLLMGALFGFCAYATYDLSNLSTLKNWPVKLTLIDLCWGTLISAVAAGAGKAAMNWMARP
jgi:uncharacterized membrane protein